MAVGSEMPNTAKGRTTLIDNPNSEKGLVLEILVSLPEFEDEAFGVFTEMFFAQSVQLARRHMGRVVYRFHRR